VKQFTLTILKPLTLLTSLYCALSPATSKAEVPEHCQQLIVSHAQSWQSKKARLQVFERQNNRSAWRAILKEEVPVLLGRNGIAWGRGVHRKPADSVAYKKEGDGKAPAGVFAVGKVYGYPPALPGNNPYPYRQVGKWDAWVDDTSNPFYNRHLIIDPRKGAPHWFESQKMRHGDFAYHWLIEIRHNSDPPRSGYGSAIFFHTRRGAARFTAGCTTMKRSDLEKLISLLDASKAPHYVLLPQKAYASLRRDWKLP